MHHAPPPWKKGKKLSVKRAATDALGGPGPKVIGIDETTPSRRFELISPAQHLSGPGFFYLFSRVCSPARSFALFSAPLSLYLSMYLPIYLSSDRSLPFSPLFSPAVDETCSRGDGCKEASTSSQRANTCRRVSRCCESKYCEARDLQSGRLATASGERESVSVLIRSRC